MTDDPSKIYLSKINLSGVVQVIKDAEARAAITVLEATVNEDHEPRIQTLEAAVTEGAHFIGKIDNTEGKTAPISDGSHESPVYIVGKTDAVTPKAGDFAIQTVTDAQGSTTTVEFIWDGIPSPDGAEVTYTGTWREMGSTGKLKKLAYKDSASASYTPNGSVGIGNSSAGGTVSAPVWTGGTPTGTAVFGGTEATITASGKPTGSVSTPTITLNKEEAQVAEAAITGPEVDEQTGKSDETLKIAFTDKTFMTGAAPVNSQPTFTGDTNTFSGTYTPAGDIDLSGVTSAGANAAPTFTPTPHNHEATWTPVTETITVE